MPTFRVNKFCQFWIVETQPVCLCADYDLNIPGNTTDYIDEPLDSCNGLHGTSVENWYEDVEATIIAIKAWDSDLRASKARAKQEEEDEDYY